MNASNCKDHSLAGSRWLARVLAWWVCLGLWCGDCQVGRADGTLPEYQVKALFVLNFTKYVEWPAQAFAGSNSPVTIGISGETKLGDALKQVVANKSVGGRAIVVRQFASTEDPSQCQILFISDSEAARMRAILDKTSALPVLTVGEDAAFAQNGGMINFVLKDGNVRLEIDLAAAKKAGLNISSRLLAVADTVKGKTN